MAGSRPRPAAKERFSTGHGGQKCQRQDLALEAFSRRIVAGKPLIINGEWSQRRDLTHVSDVARAVELALHWRGGGAVVLNVGTAESPPRLAVADEDFLAQSRRDAKEEGYWFFDS